MKKLYEKIMLALGLRCDDCGGKIYHPKGWDRTYCKDCGKRLY